jgi:NADH-quinone oxidoreductase subunit E
MTDDIGHIVRKYRGKRGALIQTLQEIQNRFGYLSQDAISALAEETEISESQIYGVASFYAKFKFKRPGLHQIKVCLGTSCHVSGGEGVMESAERLLAIRYGSTTNDGNFSLERVACLGCCGLAPVVVVDGEVHGKIEYRRLAKLIDGLTRVGDGR